jgi:hypothetical protein
MMKEPLRGVAAVNVVAVVANTCDNAVDLSLVKQDIEVKLRIAGIKVVSDAMPSQLWGTVNCAHLKGDGQRLVSALYVSKAPRQVVLVSRELKTVGIGTTWNVDNLFVCGLNQKCGELVRKAARDRAIISTYAQHCSRCSFGIGSWKSYKSSRAFVSLSHACFKAS